VPDLSSRGHKQQISLPAVPRIGSNVLPMCPDQCVTQLWRLYHSDAQPAAQADPAHTFFLETAVESSKVISAATLSGRRGSLAGIVRPATFGPPRWYDVLR